MTNAPRPDVLREENPAETMGALTDPQARWSWLVEWARRQPSLAADLRREEYQVPGCRVRLWWIAESREGRCWFRSDSDAVSLRALTGFLAHHYSGRTPEEILQGARAPLETLGLLRQLADNRRATVLRVESQLLEFARGQLAGDAIRQ